MRRQSITLAVMCLLAIITGCQAVNQKPSHAATPLRPAEVSISTQHIGGHLLEGVITDESDGKPIPKALVVLHPVGMPHKSITTRTDDQGHYKIEGIAAGNCLVHVDASSNRFVRCRKPVEIKANAKRVRLDFGLKPGVMIAGTFIDEHGQEIAIDRLHAHGSAFGTESMKDVTAFTVSTYDIDEGKRDTRTLLSGSGDYQLCDMTFPTQSSFIIQGVKAGNTFIIFSPMIDGKATLKILHRGKDISGIGVNTEPGQKLKDVSIVLGPNS